MKTPLLVSAVSALLAAASHAVVLATYDFETTGGELTNKTVVAGVTASAITFGAKAATGDSFSENTSPTGGAQSLTIAGGGLGNSAISTSAAMTEAATDGNYFSFTLNPGSAVNLTSITFDKERLAGNANDLRIVVTSSLDDTYAGRLPLTNSALSLANVLESNQGTEITAITLGTGEPWGADSNVSVNLTAAAFQNLTTPVTFRIYAFNLSSDVGSATNQLFFDNILVNGTVIPEPSTAILGVTALLGAALLRRR